MGCFEECRLLCDKCVHAASQKKCVRSSPCTEAKYYAFHGLPKERLRQSKRRYANLESAIGVCNDNKENRSGAWPLPQCNVKQCSSPLKGRVVLKAACLCLSPRRRPVSEFLRVRCVACVSFARPPARTRLVGAETKTMLSI